MIFSEKANQKRYPFILPELPHDKADLLPWVTSETFDYHYDKHHKGYVNKLNELIKETSLEDKSLEEIIIQSSNDLDRSIYNNAAQVWNHSFFWHSMTKNGGNKPVGKLLELIERDFISYENFTDQFKSKGTHFASGWVWLVLNKDFKLELISTSNADNPICSGLIPLLTCDLWEHAYYIDYRNERLKYLDIFLKNLLNWAFIEENLKKHTSLYK